MKTTGFTVIVFPLYIKSGYFIYFCLFAHRALQVIPGVQALEVLEDRRLGPNICFVAMAVNHKAITPLQFTIASSVAIVLYS